MYMSEYKKGGVFTKQNHRESFLFFLENCNVSVLSLSSLNGLVLLLTLNDGVVSPYSSFSNYHFGEPIRKICIKIIILGDNAGSWFVKYNKKVMVKQFSILSKFNDEVNIQKKINTQTSDQLEPVCPKIIFHDIVFKDEFEKSVMMLLMKNTTDTFLIDIYNSIIDLPSMNKKIGYIVMELLGDKDQFCSIDTITKQLPYAVDLDWKPDIYDNNMARLEYLRVATCGYLHSDPHKGNFYESRDYIGYYRNFHRKVILIDFDSVISLKKSEVDSLTRKYRYRKWSQAFEEIKTIAMSRQNTQLLDTTLKVRKIYEWLFNIDDTDLDTMTELYNMRLKESRNTLRRLAMRLQYDGNVTKKNKTRIPRKTVAITKISLPVSKTRIPLTPPNTLLNKSITRKNTQY